MNSRSPGCHSPVRLGCPYLTMEPIVAEHPSSLYARSVLVADLTILSSYSVICAILLGVSLVITLIILIIPIGAGQDEQPPSGPPPGKERVAKCGCCCQEMMGISSGRKCRPVSA